ncbi:MAG TPA: hypothetical protein VL500_03245 [Candidatus Eisenbacteria bacterium]|nr:hypothetical protein [Candidatus Eisenbacteria bacterium]
MDDHSSTPVTDFLQSLNQKASAVTTAEKPPEAAAAEPAKTADEEKKDEPVAVHANKIRIVTKALRAIEQNVATIIRLLEEDAPASDLHYAAGAAEPVDLSMLREAEMAGIRQVDGRVIEGVFDGTGMVGSDGKVYTVPPNYASKSKLVEGDLLKLTITPKGSFIYKQIGPIERGRVVATLGFDATIGEFYATSDSKRWSVIKASVTYFKGEPGDEVVLLVPKSAPSKWGAVENIIKKNPLV